MRVLVTGGTGYVGQRVVQRLREAGLEVTAWQRPGTQRSLSGQGIRVVEGEISDVAALALAMQGCGAVVHLVGILREQPRRGETFQRVHVQATQSVLAAAALAGVERVCHMSALGARPQAATAYHRTKWQAEEYVRASGLAWTILRPSVIFGNGGPGPNFVRLLRDWVQSLPWVPLPGDGQFPLQPVALASVAEAVLAAVLQPRQRVYELGGPEVLTYRQLLERVAASLGKQLRLLPVPLALLQTVVPWLQHLPGFPLSADQLTMLVEGNVCTDSESAYRDFGLVPIPFVPEG
ncbi:MAG: NAD(P)H-binding protein [Alicyclobacillus sp.]|nr:NAD(P)H-binding protein [Alicyclobacillus sp.]